MFQVWHLFFQSPNFPLQFFPAFLTHDIKEAKPLKKNTSHPPRKRKNQPKGKKKKKTTIFPTKKKPHQQLLGGGSKYLLFSPLPGEDSHFD